MNRRDFLKGVIGAAVAIPAAAVVAQVAPALPEGLTLDKIRRAKKMLDDQALPADYWRQYERNIQELIAYGQTSYYITPVSAKQFLKLGIR